MKIVIAPDSFKESLPADQVAKAIKRGFEKAIPSVVCSLCPVGDGGEGTVEAILHSLDLEEKWQEVTGPFGLKEEMRYFQKDQRALFEVADLVGLGKIPREKRNPLHIQTRGIGELIRHLIDQEMKDIYVGVGGTASNDGGIGIAAGLGYRFYDKNGKELPACGQTLLEFESVSKDDLYRIPEDVQIRILADVESPLCGHRGATYTFGKQKGLDPALFEMVDLAIQEFYEKSSPSTLSLKGAGAGGGIAAGLCAFAEACIVSGIDTCLDLIDFDKKVADADLVIVGEGRLDSQSFAGKAPIGVAKRTPVGVPVIAICGSLSEDLPPLPFENIQATFSILEKNEPLENSLKNASFYLEHTATNIGHLLNMRKD
ncbi:glycerate kinase [Streptococcus oralis]|uniref:Glycerate kinase n=1 Tax=Streptococcus oralis subsp. dentisani TaxID=1458253 RepID=A0A1X1IS42_STROR|nr:glycerate kinase [Streptococcus oralis]ORO75940.1 glycerate kinase [Streptococcus oralis subsp. dentisani]